MNNKKVIIFGASTHGSRIIESLPSDEIPVAYVDNDARKVGKTQNNIPIISISNLPRDFNKIYIAAGATQAICTQLLKHGIPQSKIHTPELFEKENVEKLDSFKNKHNGQRVVILGNGPSLTVEDLDKVHQARVPSFAFNKIYLAFQDTAYRPTYYMVEDLLVAKNNAQVLNKLTGFTKFYADYTLRYLKRDLDSVIFGVNNTDLKKSKLGDIPFSTNPLEFYCGGMVVYSAMQMAVYMGFKEIYLMGLDFKFKESNTDPNDKNILVNNNEVNHFHPEYRSLNEKWTKPNIEYSKRAFESASRYAKETGVKIVNISRQTQLDVFEKRALESVF